ncbi:MAG: RNA polymerase sigma-70 factor [Niabella sp.]|nr:RNA polymerase sigma-70 factor [Niabella sp.]
MLLDDRLLAQLKNGETKAFAAIYNKYHQQLYSYILYFIKDRQFAEDVLQEVFVKIWKHRERINPQLSFNSYIYRIARNAVLNRMRSMAYEKVIEYAGDEQFSYSNNEDAFLWKQYSALFREAVEHLSEQRKKVFQLCREEKKTYANVSQELGIATSTVQDHMVKAIRFIKDYVTKRTGLQLDLFILILLTHLFLQKL